MDEVGTLQRELICPKCGGQRRYSPARESLKCLSCGYTDNLDRDNDHEARVEHSYDPDTPQTEPPTPGTEAEHRCGTCGGSVIFAGAALSEHCPFCNSPVVLSPPQEGYEAMALIPFRITEETALGNASDWAQQRIAAPNDLSSQLTDAQMVGLYAPFWTFDSKEAVSYWAKYNTGSGDNRRTHNVSGQMNISFDDLLVPASPYVTPLIRDGILHDFDPRRLRPFRAGYLAGFAAERHHQTVAEGLEANREDKRLLIRNRIKAHINKRRVHSINYRTDTTGLHYRRILLPVWILHYRYNGKPKKIVVSGIDGRTFGERPFSMWKLALYSSVLSAAAIGLGLLWGAAGLL